MRIKWEGVFPAITTKFDANDKLELKTFGKNLDEQLEAGIAGIVIGGTLGEASVLTLEEKTELLRYAIDHVNGKIPVILNIAEGATRDAIQIAQSAQKTGVTGLMLLPPMRYKSDHRETVTYFKSIARETDLQIMIYNNPIDYRIEVTPDMFEELTVCNNIDVIKDSTRDVINVTRMINRFGDRFSILCGVDPLALECLALGANGWVAGLVCAFPRETVAIYKLVKAGMIEDALKIYRWFMPLLELDIHSKLVQYIKLAEQEAGMGTEYVRPPRLLLEGKEREEILSVIRKGLAERPTLPDYHHLMSSV